MSLRNVLRPFASPNYRLYFTGQTVSLIGTWMSQTASLWLVYHLTSSPALLGVLGFVSQVPMFLFAPVAGVVIDRTNRRKLLLTTQVLSMGQSCALAGLVLSDHITVHLLIGLTLFQGVVNGFDLPIRQTMIYDLIEVKDHLGSAIALNSSMFNLARLIGPALGGLMIWRFGAGNCFLADGLSFLAAIVTILLMRLPPQEYDPTPKHPLRHLHEGFNYAWGHLPIRAIILLVACVSLAGFSYTFLMPVYSRDIFHGDARTLGTLMSAIGVGALAGAIYLGSRKSILGIGKVISFGGFTMGASLLCFAYCRWLPASLFFLTLTGLGVVILMASCNTLLQHLVDNERRGRVMSLFTMSFTGTMPFGTLALGAVSVRIGVPTTIFISGLTCLAAVAVFYVNLPRLRKEAIPIMEKLDTLPEELQG